MLELLWAPNAGLDRVSAISSEFQIVSDETKPVSDRFSWFQLVSDEFQHLPDEFQLVSDAFSWVLAEPRMHSGCFRARSSRLAALYSWREQFPTLLELLWAQNAGLDRV